MNRHSRDRLIREIEEYLAAWSEIWEGFFRK